jgi:hypothetical protein
MTHLAIDAEEWRMAKNVVKGDIVPVPRNCAHHPRFGNLLRLCDPPPRLFLRFRVNFLSHEPGFEDFRISYFFGMTFMGQSENILVHDDKVP